MALAAAGLAVSVAGRAAEQAPAPFPGLLDEHPAIQSGLRPTTEPVARVNAALRDGTRRLAREPGVGYLRAVLAALEVSAESQSCWSSPRAASSARSPARTIRARSTTTRRLSSAAWPAPR